MIHDARLLLSRCGFVLVGLISLWGGEISGWAQDAGVRLVGPEDGRIRYSDYVHMELVTSPVDAKAKLARFDRFLDIPGKGYHYDNPGARARDSERWAAQTRQR